PAGYPRPTLVGKSLSRLVNDACDGTDLDKYQPHLKLPCCVRQRKTTGRCGTTPQFCSDQSSAMPPHTTGKTCQIFLVGGNDRHGTSVAHDALNMTPPANRFVALAQRIEMEIDGFGSSTATSIRGLETT
ncbi:MAG: hypothetical protein ACPGXX_21905, partial [Planctomycetaceae bacterium]